MIEMVDRIVKCTESREADFRRAKIKGATNDCMATRYESEMVFQGLAYFARPLLMNMMQRRAQEYYVAQLYGPTGWWGCRHNEARVQVSMANDPDLPAHRRRGDAMPGRRGRASSRVRSRSAHDAHNAKTDN